MAIIGIYTDRTNPTYTSSDFTFWMPQFANFIATESGQTYFENIYPIVNAKIFKSIFGADWKLAMSYGIAHYITIIAQQQQAPSGSTLSEIAGGGTIKGVLESATIGDFSKTYALDKTVADSEDALFWNQTSYGAALMALLKTKSQPSIMVVTSGPIVPPRR